MISARNVRVERSGRALLDGVSLDLHAGEILALLGPNGAGKSTLMGVLSGDVDPGAGSVEFAGKPIGDWSLSDLARRRSVLLQDNQITFPFTVHQVVEMGRAPWRRTPLEDDDNSAISEALAATDIAHLGNRRVPSLSGGERARVAFARVMSGRTGVLMLDEPTAGVSAEGALRPGAGLVSVATTPAHAATLGIGRPELMVAATQTAADLAPLLARSTVRAIGPGLGRDAWAEQMFRGALSAPGPLVVDADGLNLLAEAPRRRADWILTPHPAEAARLLGTTTADIQADRLAAVRALTMRYGGVALLKGAGTLIDDGRNIDLCEGANPGLASGGMGDVLTGLIAGLLAQGLPPADAARGAVRLQLRAGTLAAWDLGQPGMLAGDLLARVAPLLGEPGDIA